MYYVTTELHDDREVNIGKLLILRELYCNDLITEEIFKDYSVNYAIIVKKPSFFNSFWNKFYKKDEHRYILIKQVGLQELDEDEPNDNKTNLKVIKLDKNKGKGEK